MTTVAEMTIEDLREFVDQAIDKRLTQLLGSFEIAEETHDEGESWDEIRDEVERHRWTPPLGAKSSLELLREDRDR